MTQIKNQEEFLNWLSSPSKDYIQKRYAKTYYHPESELLILGGLEILNREIHDRHFECTEFRNCKFENCDFTSSFFSSCTLENCHFQDCKFTWSKFLDVDLFKCQFEACNIVDLELSDAVIKNSLFINCGEILDLRIRGNRERKITFINSYIHHLDIEPIRENEIEEINFIECLIKESSFDRVNFSNGLFQDCNLSLNQFSACEFSSETFKGLNQTPSSEFNLIDIRTILNSPPINQINLEKLFGIHTHDVKEYMLGMTNKIEFQSIFISYSFKDKEFAEILNAELMKRGILTFLWEKDAPGGKTLKSIMTDGVKNKDRVLFIASKDSLKSEACHFELSTGRKKQESTWEDVLFPIHIDNYLFEITKEKIRPKEVQNEYWTNIEELKELHSLSFCEFTNSKIKDNSQFEKQLLKLIKGLRKE